jgi:hypothetical protein
VILLRNFRGNLNSGKMPRVFLQRLRREEISRRHLYSYRRLGHLCQTLCQESRAGREAVSKQLAQLQAGTGTADDDQSASTHGVDSRTEGEGSERSLTREQSSSRLGRLETESAGSNSPRPLAAVSSPALRLLQTGGNAPPKPKSHASHTKNQRSFGNSNSSVSSSCSDSYGGSSSCFGGSSCSGGSSFSGSSGKWENGQRGPPPKPKPVPLVVKAPVPLVVKKPEATQGPKGKSTLLAALSADLDDD